MIKQYFEGVLHLFQHPTLVSEEILVLKLKEIILLLLHSEEAPQVRLIMQALFSKRTYDFKEVVETHICSPLSLEELASLTNLSLSSFRRTFKEIYGEPPGKYLIQRRVEMVAKRL